ncbi:ribosome recycling factor [Candidatus Wolfebacteria bacterium]|nr:ribosome recycling factor [Candidatus Wolfebacteria bacterium]
MDFVKEFTEETARFIRRLEEAFAGIRGGRPSARLVEDLVVDYAGQKLKIKQLGSITVIPPREIQITVWDHGMAGAVETVVAQALTVGARTEGSTVRVSLPPLSEERRAELQKLVKREAEEVKIKIRTLRDELLKKIKASVEEKKLTEDDKFSFKEKIDARNRAVGEEVEGLVLMKMKELNE